MNTGMAFHVRKSDQRNGFHIKDLMIKGHCLEFLS